LLVAAGQCLVQLDNQGARTFRSVVVLEGEAVGNTVATGQLDDADQRQFADAVSIPDSGRVFRNDGERLVAEHTVAEPAYGQPGGLLVANLAGDSNDDIAVITASRDMRVWIGDGRGNFATGPFFGIGTGEGRTLYAIAAARAAEDPALDLLMVDDFGPAVLPNEGDQFQRAVYASFPPDEIQRFVTGADFDGDGCTDAFTMDGGPERTHADVTGHYFANSCDGSGNLIEQAQFPLPHAVFATTAPWDDAGVIGLVVAQGAPENRVTLFLADPSGSQGLTRVASLTMDGDPRSIAVGDFDASGRPDLAVVLRQPAAIRVLFDSL
jgi:hypothetical protein